MKQGAIFDMDGLMFDTEAMYQEIWHEIAAEMGIVLPEQFVIEISGTSGELLKSVIRKYYHTDDPMALFQRVVTNTQEKLKTYVPVKPGLIDLLEYFQETGVKLAVASSSYPEMIESNLKVSDTAHYFDRVVSGSQLSRGKPAPDIFLYAAEQLGLDAQDCYVFEDSTNGVLAGLAAGCSTVMIPDYVQPNETIKHSEAHIYASLNEALDAIKAGQI